MSAGNATASALVERHLERMPRRLARRGAASRSASRRLGRRCRRSDAGRDRRARSASSRSLGGTGVDHPRRAAAGGAIASGVLGFAVGYLATRSEHRQARDRRRLVGALRRDAPLRDAAHLRRDRRHVLRALRRREHRPRGDDADGRVLRIWAPTSSTRGCSGSSPAWPPAASRARPRRLLDPPARGPDRQRHGDQLPRARPHRLPVRRHLRPARGRRPTSRASRTSTSPSSRTCTSSGRARAAEPDDLARAAA